MTDRIAETARAAAQRLAPALDPRLPLAVEQALHRPAANTTPNQYLDPISCAGLVVSVATLAWTIYQDLRTHTDKPTAEIIARRIRIETHNQAVPHGITTTQRDRIIAVVIDETLHAPETTDP